MQLHSVLRVFNNILTVCGGPLIRAYLTLSYSIIAYFHPCLPKHVLRVTYLNLKKIYVIVCLSSNNKMFKGLNSVPSAVHPCPNQMCNSGGLCLEALQEQT